METVSLTVADLRALFKDRVVLLIGDSIVRGMFKDLACLLTGNDRLLQLEELNFNRHEKKQGTFNEIIDTCTVDRTNSTFNQEKRILRSCEYGYDLTYVFCSRIWNNHVSQIIPSIETYDIVLISSQIWDLTRYYDENGDIYLKNMDILFEKLKCTEKHIICTTTPSVDNRQYSKLGQLRSKINRLSISKAVEKNFFILDLNAELQNQLYLRSHDGIHWSPGGLRLIMEYLAKCIHTIPQEKNSNVIDVSQPVHLNKGNHRILFISFYYYMFYWSI